MTVIKMGLTAYAGMIGENMSCNNINNCNCTFPCSHHGKCCECIDYHNSMKEFPACFFSKQMEKTGDRSLSALIKDRNK